MASTDVTVLGLLNELRPRPWMAACPGHIMEISEQTGVAEEEVYALARDVWRLPTVAPWNFFKRHPYS